VGAEAFAGVDSFTLDPAARGFPHDWQNFWVGLCSAPHSPQKRLIIDTRS